MENNARIGNVVEKGGGRFEWIIPDFSTLPRRTDARFDSPIFDADGERWCLGIYPNGIDVDTSTRIFLFRKTFRNRISISCTLGMKRADHSEETIGTENSRAHFYSLSIFNTTRRGLEEGGWLLDDQLTATCLIGGAHASQAGRKVTSRKTRTDVVDVKIRKKMRLDNCTSTEAKGDRRLIENVKGLLTEENDDYDVTIVVKGKEFRAHRLILKARSRVLGMMLTHDSKEKNSGTIHIEDCDPDCFDQFLLFVYSGRTENLTTSKALSLYYAADKYDFPDLKENCVTFLKTSLSTASLYDVIHLATLHEDKELLQTATQFFAKNIHEILPTAEWQSFMRNYTDQANELYMNALKIICPKINIS